MIRRTLLSVLIFITFILVGAVGFTSASFAEGTNDTNSTNSETNSTQPSSCNAKSGFLGFPTWYKYLDVQQDENGCHIITKSPTTDSVDSGVIIKIMLAVVDILLYVSGIAAVVFVVYGGFLFVVSQGEPGKLASARKTILNAVIGLIIVLLATPLVRFLANFLSTKV